MMRKALSVLLALVMLTACLPAMAEGYSDMLAKGNEFLAAGDLAKALASYQLAQRIQPEEEAAYLGEANVRILQENLSAAAAIIDAIFARNPASPGAWGLKCRIDVLQGDISAFEADAVFAEVCGADLTEAYLAAAELYAAVGMKDKAAEILAKATMNIGNLARQIQEQETPASTGAAEAASADASVRNSALDSAFEAGRLTLEKAEFPAVTADAIEIADEVWGLLGQEKPADPAALIAASLSELPITWLSLSPSGNSGLLTAEGMPGISYYNGKYHLLYPSQTRGVADTNGSLARMYEKKFQTLIGNEGVVYSPDGRYAAFTDYHALTSMQLGREPVVIDLSTGEMILIATYAAENLLGRKIMATAAFSSDGRYMYYMLYGNGTEFRTALYRYDLQEGKTELCYSGSNGNYLPSLFELKDGSLLVLRDMFNGEAPGITRISFENGAWTGAEYTFDLFPRINQLRYSANSGYAVVYDLTSIANNCVFQCIRPEEGFAGLNQYHAISKADNQILTFTAEEFDAMSKEWDAALQSGTAESMYQAMSVQRTLNTVLSPDGHYALMLTVHDGTPENPAESKHLYLVRLDDLSIKEVAGIDPGVIPVGAPARNFRQLIEWNTDTLLIGTSDGVQAYRFQP